VVAKLKLKVTRESEAARFPCCGIPSNHSNHTHKLLGGSSIETKKAYQLSQVNDLLRRIWGLPYVSSQGYNVVPKSKSKSKGWEVLGASGSGKTKCQVSQVRELLERFIR
jgi:hypothetical protein